MNEYFAATVSAHTHTHTITHTHSLVFTRPTNIVSVRRRRNKCVTIKATRKPTVPVEGNSDTPSILLLLLLLFLFPQRFPPLLSRPPGCEKVAFNQKKSKVATNSDPLSVCVCVCVRVCACVCVCVCARLPHTHSHDVAALSTLFISHKSSSSRWGDCGVVAEVSWKRTTLIPGINNNNNNNNNNNMFISRLSIRQKQAKTRLKKASWMYPSLDALLSLVVCVPLFIHGVCTIYDHAFLGVYNNLL